MVKITSFAMALVLAFGVMVVQAYSEEPMARTMGRLSTLSTLVGTQVSNPKGEDLGRITDFVIDSQGHATFVVVGHGGFWGVREKEVAIPFDSFTYNREKHHFVIDLTKERLNSAPAFSMRELSNEKWAEDVYRYFGQAPYWTEGELVEEGMKLHMEDPTRALESPYNPYPVSP